MGTRTGLPVSASPQAASQPRTDRVGVKVLVTLGIVLVTQALVIKVILRAVNRGQADTAR